MAQPAILRRIPEESKDFGAARAFWGCFFARPPRSYFEEGAFFGGGETFFFLAARQCGERTEELAHE